MGDDKLVQSIINALDTLLPEPVYEREVENDGDGTHIIFGDAVIIIKPPNGNLAQQFPFTTCRLKHYGGYPSWEPPSVDYVDEKDHRNKWDAIREVVMININLAIDAMAEDEAWDVI